MEAALNLAWLVLAVLLLRHSYRASKEPGQSRKLKFGVVALIALLLFPVISVSDDLLLAQAPVEINNSLRRDHTAQPPHSITPEVAALPLACPEMSHAGWLRLRACIPHGHALQAAPFAASLANRPPPVD